MISAKLAPFGTTIFSEMTRLANAHGAINLAQGFPDFDGPPAMIDAAARALHDGHNQYTRSMGHPKLVEAIRRFIERTYGLAYDPETEIAVTSGCTEAIATSLIGLLNPGETVLLFEPFYDSYPASVAMAGATARYVTLRHPDFALDESALARVWDASVRVVLVNNPHNPSGKVFTRAELELVANFARRHDTIVVSDEVYENLTYDGAPHNPIASLPDMRKRTLTLSSAGKTFSCTGWKVGWVTGPASLVAATQAAHQFTTFCTPPAFQIAVAAALDAADAAFLATYRAEYTARRDFLLAALQASGFCPIRPRGTYFILADYSALSHDDDLTFARRLVTEIGVAAVPPSVFYAADKTEGRRLLRFAFCKRPETLDAAAERLNKLRLTQ
ncbi:MAG: aminotransferase class I/II-fold pyridoxal phosphate-dependent enzyme [Deltaproteobacteria bacterium]|nr:aminotransferase class I/II-fold pyridoxal phosphate-dependent enzyme [Deltaproteobacteria bacterium]